MIQRKGMTLFLSIEAFRLLEKLAAVDKKATASHIGHNEMEQGKKLV